MEQVWTTGWDAQELELCFVVHHKERGSAPCM